MKCNDVLDTVYEADPPFPLGKRLNLAFHIIFCGHCALHLDNYAKTRSLLQANFFPSSPDFSNSIMNSIYQETDESAFDEEAEEHFFGTGGFSVRGWIFAGIILLLSLTTVFFGQDFTSIALDEGSSFLLPLGIITGVVITGYGALFIGSHLKEFSERFKL